MFLFAEMPCGEILLSVTEGMRIAVYKTSFVNKKHHYFYVLKKNKYLLD